MQNLWIVSQLGARQHYGIARGLHRAGQLRLMYTDAWAGRGRRWFAQGPRLLRGFANRYHADLPSDRVVSFTGRAVWDEVRRLRRAAAGDGRAEHRHDEWLRIGQRFASTVAADLSRRPLDPAADVFFGFDTGCLETLRLCNDRGLLSVCDQVDPARVEEDLVRAESDRWPGWSRHPVPRAPDAYWERLSAEWATASVVVVNSEWTRSALVAQGVPAGKVAVIPPPYEPRTTALPPPRPPDGKLVVLWLGTVNLRKGIPYLLDAARRLVTSNPAVEIVVAGPVHIADQVVASAPANVRFVGRVDRDQAEACYRRADVFVLPSLSDGFGVTQLEAMAQGLPVITTPRCGRVVTPGLDGLVVPPADADALAAAIAALDGDRRLLREMSRNAAVKSAQFHLRQHARRLDELATRLRGAGTAVTEPGSGESRVAV